MLLIKLVYEIEEVVKRIVEIAREKMREDNSVHDVMHSEVVVNNPTVDSIGDNSEKATVDVFKTAYLFIVHLHEDLVTTND